MRGIVLHFGLCILVLVGLGGSLASQPEEPRPLTVCPEGPPVCQFSTIEAAVEAASPYDLIQLYPGTYRETLTIAKSLRLVATELERVLLQGARIGEPTLTLQVQDRLDITIEGLTLLAPPDPEPTEPTGTCRDREALICSNGIDIRGQGTLGLTLVNVQITQRENHGAIGLDCFQFTGTAQVMLRRSRIAANRVGMWWTCRTTGTLETRETVVSGNSVGISISSSPMEGRLAVFIEDSLFTANSGSALDLEGKNTEVRLQHSQFLNNGIGVFANLSTHSRLEAYQSLLWRNTKGMALGLLLPWAEETQFLLRDVQIVESREEGVIIATAGRTEIRNALIEGNGHGVRVIQASNLLTLYDNKIVRNEGWGVALDRSECFIDLVPVFGSRKVFIAGENNEIRDNGKGNLCPEDYNWPQDFMKP